MCLCVEVMDMSSAYTVSVMLPFGGVGMSEVYVLKRVGERTPWGTPV